jgi:hypothetical protein
MALHQRRLQEELQVLIDPSQERISSFLLVVFITQRKSIHNINRSRVVHSTFHVNTLINLLGDRMINLWETGLLIHWHSWYVPVPYRCLQVHRQKENKPRLSMKHLSSAFVVLCGGCCASLILFVGELIIFKMRYSSVKVNISPK